ncbi:uncharacterized protein LOC143063623 [Mytilus galloprovincialis]|uniref:uncharacterized protein LOC143063623 n=1 Tax=Mytilus galloprovincialis TaxID=29158 RepID=UPI003F7BAC0A
MATTISFIISFCVIITILHTQVFTVNSGPPYVRFVHVLFMNHLDVGYNGIPQTGFINNILNTYFHEYFPRAVNLSRELRDKQYQERFIYTTHPWLVSLYVDCPQGFILNNITLKCPSDQDLKAFKEAVTIYGDITWHAGPMNMQMENMNEILLGLSLNISSDLDEMFNLTRKYRTLSQRDVPGMTQAIIPTLVEKGIQAVSVGVNPGTSPPAVPNLFRWQFEEKEVLGTWHAGGYPLNPGPDPAHPGGLSRKDCVVVENVTEALCFAFRTDNSGPPENIEEILNYYEILRLQFPGAEIDASTFEDYIEAIQPIKNQLPVLTQEIGDTWIQGISSDPYKLTFQRTFQTGLELCFHSNECNYTDPRIKDAVRFLVKVPEHTWGLPSVRDNINWTNVAFQKALTGSNYRNCVMAWQEQREFLHVALDKLGNHPLADIVEYLLSETNPVDPDVGEYQIQNITSILSRDFECEQGMKIGFNGDGSLRTLYDPFNKVNWVSNASNPMGAILYNTYNESDFNYMSSLYNYYGGAGYDKPNSTKNANPESKLWKTKLNRMWRLDQDSCRFVLELVMENATANTSYGAPQTIIVEYNERQSDETSPAGFEARVILKNKTPSRLAESISYYFSPAVPKSNLKWYLSKVGHLVDPSNVIQNGSQYVHAVDNGAYYIDESGNGLQLITKDAPLVVIGTKTKHPSPFPVPLEPITVDDIKGIGFNIYNNIWNTNYVLWYPYDENDYDKSIQTRYSIDFMVR